MPSESVTYPVYRRYLNGQTYVKISSPEKLEEIQLVGSKYLVHTIEARTLPDRNHIYDLTFDYASYALEISAEEYHTLKDKSSR